MVLMSHLGRPDGKKNAKFTLAPVAEELKKVLGKWVVFPVWWCYWYVFRVLLFPERCSSYKTVLVPI